ncbi:hypothetical protein MPR_1045 [Myroides profundi]|nr:hypothetical protein MPR_1045 [Myroides profundi]
MQIQSTNKKTDIVLYNFEEGLYSFELMTAKSLTVFNYRCDLMC